MRSPIAKFAVAAAVVATALIGATLFRSSGSGVVWAEVAQKVQASRNVVFRTVRHDTSEPYDGGVDFSMDHYSSTQARLDRYKAGEVVNTMYNDCDTKTVILVDHYHKSYVQNTAEERMPDRFQMTDPNSMVQRFLSCKHRELGRKTIDGVLCEGIETTDPALHGGENPPESLAARIWVSVETGYPVRIEAEYIRDNGQRRFDFVQDQFQWDAELDESIFEPNIPAGYIDISPDEW
ncbi:hypothetical protein [Anaerobaca lacustris]|uniref:Uncharacterized protein n=1 Tax=Anaerobaca lacustris TaxID=3044600 RepID=A0AAW6TV22_9BACT|nr:hypothetical protein [Sedimentisphaerales bacterium M17dextr]